MAAASNLASAIAARQAGPAPQPTGGKVRPGMPPPMPPPPTNRPAMPPPGTQFQPAADQAGVLKAGMAQKSAGTPPNYGGMGGAPGGVMGGAASPGAPHMGGKSGMPPPQYGAAGPGALAGQMRQDAVRGPAPAQMMR